MIFRNVFILAFNNNTAQSFKVLVVNPPSTEATWQLQLRMAVLLLENFTAGLNDSLGNSLRDLGTIAAELVDAVEGMKK